MRHPQGPIWSGNGRHDRVSYDKRRLCGTGIEYGIKKILYAYLQVRPLTLSHESTVEDSEGMGQKLPSIFQDSAQGWDQSSPVFGCECTQDP